MYIWLCGIGEFFLFLQGVSLIVNETVCSYIYHFVTENTFLNNVGKKTLIKEYYCIDKKVQSCSSIVKHVGFDC